MRREDDCIAARGAVRPVVGENETGGGKTVSLILNSVAQAGRALLARYFLRYGRRHGVVAYTSRWAASKEELHDGGTGALQIQRAYFVVSSRTSHRANASAVRYRE